MSGIRRYGSGKQNSKKAATPRSAGKKKQTEEKRQREKSVCRTAARYLALKICITDLGTIQSILL